MTGTEVLEKFHNMIDDELDADFELQMLNDAKDAVEAEADWAQLKASTSYSIASGHAYTSSAGTLPTRFIMDLLLTEGNGVDYGKIAFEDLTSRQNGARKYWLDIAGNALYISGSAHAAKTLTLFHTTGSADIAAGTSWAFPARFHRILPLKMAELYYLADATEKSRAFNPEWRQQYAECLAQMRVWDDRLKVKNRATRSGTVSTGRNVYP